MRWAEDGGGNTQVDETRANGPSTEMVLHWCVPTRLAQLGASESERCKELNNAVGWSC